MYDYIKGQLAYKGETYAVVEAGGIGYRVTTSRRSLANFLPSDEITIYTHLHVREDIFELYGFVTKEERGMFLLLTAITGVGPKAAISILSALSPSELALAVIGGDSKMITQAQGVGAKLASRIILELKDKMDSTDILPQDTMRASFIVNNDAVAALIALGYSNQEASNAIKAANAEQDNTEDAIKKALVQLMRG